MYSSFNNRKVIYEIPFENNNFGLSIVESYYIAPSSIISFPVSTSWINMANCVCCDQRSPLFVEEEFQFQLNTAEDLSPQPPRASHLGDQQLSAVYINDIARTIYIYNI